MMFGHDFYHGTIRRYIIMFGNLFNEIQVDRFNSTGTKIQSVNVPIAYGPKQKFIERYFGDPTLTKSIATTLPRLGFEFTSMSYAPQRKLNTGHKYIKGTIQSGNSFDSTYVPVPYDLNFSLHALVKNAEDGVQIIEQIVPFFTPDWVVTVKVLPQLGINLDVPIELASVTSTDEYEGDFESQRVITWQLDFVVKGYLFGPVTRNKFIANADINSSLQQIQIVPVGTVPGSNVAQESTINTSSRVTIQTFNANNDFGFSETILTFPLPINAPSETLSFTSDSTSISTDLLTITTDAQ
jgi:hypothetical protein